MRESILQVLSRRVVVADGAMGSVLFEKGLDQDRCYDALNLEDPGLVASIHQDYIRAGAELIETNTFGANRFKLERFHREGEVAAVNRRGAEIARECAGDEVWVAGAMGAAWPPAGPAGEPRGHGRGLCRTGPRPWPRAGPI